MAPDRWAFSRSSSARAPSPSRLQSPPSLGKASDPATDLLSLISEALEVLRLIEESRQERRAEFSLDLQDLSKLVLSVVEVCKVGVKAVSGDSACGAMLLRSDNYALPCLQSYISRAAKTLSRLLRHDEEEPNYFGVFKPSVLLTDLSLVQEALADLLEDVAAQQPRPMTHLDQLIASPTARRFWEKHAGEEALACPWLQLSAAFLDEYGPHPDEALDKLQKVLLREDLLLESGVVSAQLFGRLTAEHDGLYELFQHAADPGTMLFVMGTVEDDSHRQQQQVMSYLPLPLETFLGVSIAQICCGGQHAALLTASGLVYTWGRGGFGRLGHGDDITCSAPTLVRDLAEAYRCRQVCCGFAYTAAVTLEGQVFTWGAGENGRLGLGDEQDKTSPKHVSALQGERVKEVFAGSVHTCALLEDGRLFSWGKAEYTGHGFKQDVWSPVLLDGFQGQPVVQVSVGPGGYHTIALCSNGSVWTWGHNRVGQLGYKNTEAVPRNVEGAFFLPTPRLVESLQGLRVVKVVAGWGHSAAVCQNGDVYTCGRNAQGQLGLGDPNSFERNERNHPFLPRFRLLRSLKGQRVTQFACGGEHSTALLANDDVYCWGAGSRGQLGHGPPSPHGGNGNEVFPRLNMEMRRIKRHIHQVACGNNCTVLLVGRFRVPKLQEICVEALAKHSHLYQGTDLEELLPPELYCMLSRLKGEPVTEETDEGEFSASLSSAV